MSVAIATSDLLIFGVLRLTVRTTIHAQKRTMFIPVSEADDTAWSMITLNNGDQFNIERSTDHRTLFRAIWPSSRPCPEEYPTLIYLFGYPDMSMP